MKNKFTNRDFYFSAYLIANGCKLSSHTKDRGITTFIFDDERISELADNYYSMNALVEPIAFGNALKTLKSIIHSSDANSKGFNNSGNKFTNN